jgi:hypothetical protein
MSTVVYYAGLGSVRTPFDIENIMRGIGRLWSGLKVLRTCGALGGDASFEDGTRTVGGGVEVYTPGNIQPWALELVQTLDPKSFSQVPDYFHRRAAACIHAVLGLEGNSHSESLVVWLDPNNLCPQHWGFLAAQKFEIPIHNLADTQVSLSWATWVKDNTPAVDSESPEGDNVPHGTAASKPG